MLLVLVLKVFVRLVPLFLCPSFFSLHFDLLYHGVEMYVRDRDGLHCKTYYDRKN